GENALILVTPGGGLQRELFDVPGQADLAIKILDQPPPPYRIKLQRINECVEQRNVARADVDVPHSKSGGRLQRQSKHFPVRGGAILPAKRCASRLQELAWSVPAIAEHRTKVAEAGRLACLRGGQIIARHRDREVGPEAELFAARVSREVEAFANVLAREVEERFRRLQDRGLGAEIAGLGKRLQQRGRPIGGRAGGGSRGAGHGHLSRGQYPGQTGSKSLIGAAPYHGRSPVSTGIGQVP